MVEYNKEVMGDASFKAFLKEKFNTDVVSPEEMSAVLGSFFEQNKDMLEKYPTKEMAEAQLKDKEAAELKSFLDANNISRDEYAGSTQDVKDFLAKEMESEKSSELAGYLESKGMSIDDYNNADKATKDNIAKGMASQNEADLKAFLVQNNISMDDYNSSKGDIKNWVDGQMKDEKRLKSFLDANNMTKEEYNSADSKTKGWLNQEMQKQKEEKAAKFGKSSPKEAIPDDRSEITPSVAGAEISPKDTSDKEVSPTDAVPSGKKEEDKMKATDGHRKSGMKNTDEEEDAKGPFKEGDIIDYMYNEWMIAAANWCYKKVGKKIKEWGSSAYLAYLDGLSEGRKKKEELKKEGKPHKTLDKYLETQEKARAINDKYSEFFSKNIDGLNDTFKKIKEGKFEDVNFGLSKDDHAKLLDSFNKSKEGKLSEEERKNISPTIGSKLQFLEKLQDLKNKKVNEEDLKKLPPERREEFLKSVKDSKDPLADFCESSQKKMENMKENFEIVSKIAANFTSAKLGDQMARDENFNESAGAPKNLEVQFMKETMLTIFSRMNDIEERGGDSQEFLEQLAKASGKAKKTTDRRINGNITMEYGAKPLVNSGLRDFEELMHNPEADERSKGKVSMYDALRNGHLSDEGQAKVVETLTRQISGIRGKEESHQERVDKLDETKETIFPDKEKSKNNEENVEKPANINETDEILRKRKSNER